MRGILRYLDRRLLVGIGVVLVVVFLLRATWIGSSNSDLTSAIGEKAAAEKDLESFRTRLVEIRSDGVSTGEALLQRIARLEVLVPAQNDVLSVSSNFIAISESSGVVLESFAPVDAGEGGKEETVARVLRGSRFSFSASGDYDSVARFLENVVASPRFVATIDSLSVTGAGTDAETGKSTGMFGSVVKVAGDVVVWSLIDKPLTNAVAPPVKIGDASGSASGGSSTTLPESTTTVPGSPTTVPASPTTLPAAPTTVPAKPGAATLDPKFASCAEAIAAGFGPYVEGDDPEYDFYADEDVDGEGVVCTG